jgi:hypothetical protein
VNTPPMLSGRAGVIVTLHSPAAEVNSAGPSGPWTVNESTVFALVGARLTNDVPDSRNSLGPLVHVMSIGAGGGAQTAGVWIVVSATVVTISPVSVMLALPTASALSGPGEPEGLAEGVSLTEPSPVDGGEIVGGGP